MKIVMIGAGNLATHLAKALFGAGHDIVQVFSRTEESANELSKTVGASPTTDLNQITTQAEAYIFALKDSVLANVIPVVCKGREKALMIHTAGSMPLSAFQGMALHYGVLYPMMTFSKQFEIDFQQVPCFIEGNDDYSVKMVQDLARSVSPKVYSLSSQKRQDLHLSAVWACNFANHCFDVASNILSKQNIPFEVLLPLIDETTRKIHTISPHQAQTGPAIRYDENVIRSHAALLKDNPLLKDLYERMSLSINKFSKNTSK